MKRSPPEYYGQAFDDTEYLTKTSVNHCAADEDLFGICYLCGKVLESKHVRKECCESQDDTIRNFCLRMFT